MKRHKRSGAGLGFPAPDLIQAIILLAGLMIAVALIIVISMDYRERIEQHNAYVCGVYGKQPDCVTPLE
jgi:hypothetical protein